MPAKYWNLKHDVALLGLRRKGWTTGQIARKLGIATTTVTNRLNTLGVKGFNDGYYDLLLAWINYVEDRKVTPIPSMLYDYRGPSFT
ncbi:Protein of unknown function (plasmid) [Magnetospira sp. QH-2]|nr:Protein of unknown function [Magnetospira sp. QH-2]